MKLGVFLFAIYMHRNTVPTDQLIGGVVKVYS